MFGFNRGRDKEWRDSVDRKLSVLQSALATIASNQQKEFQKMSQIDDKLTDIENKVDALTTVEASAKALIVSIPSLIAAAVLAAQHAAPLTPAQLAVFDDLNTKLTGAASDLAAAVAANTGTPTLPPPSVPPPAAPKK